MTLPQKKRGDLCMNIAVCSSAVRQPPVPAISLLWWACVRGNPQEPAINCFCVNGVGIQDLSLIWLMIRTNEYGTSCYCIDPLIYRPSSAPATIKLPDYHERRQQRLYISSITSPNCFAETPPGKSGGIFYIGSNDSIDAVRSCHLFERESAWT